MIYKYCSVNEYSISNLIRDELFCSSYLAFNDPFECWFTLEKDKPNPKSDQVRFRRICEAWGWEPKIEKSDWEIYEQYMDELEDYQPDIMSFVEKTRICCFSKSIDNLLMWAHYADGMRGFCIEFDEVVLLTFDTDKEASILPVHYFEIPPVVDTMLYSLAKDQIWYHEMAISEDPQGVMVKDYSMAITGSETMLNDLYSKTIASKPIEWGYEEEVRLVYNAEDLNNRFFKYPFQAVKKVIFGYRIDAKARETIKKILHSKNNQLEIFIAERAESTYTIKFNPDK